VKTQQNRQLFLAFTLFNLFSMRVQLFSRVVSLVLETSTSSSACLEPLLWYPPILSITYQLSSFSGIVLISHGVLAYFQGTALISTISTRSQGFQPFLGVQLIPNKVQLVTTGGVSICLFASLRLYEVE